MDSGDLAPGNVSAASLGENIYGGASGAIVRNAGNAF